MRVCGPTWRVHGRRRQGVVGNSANWDARPAPKETDMGLEDKAKNLAEDVKGKLKEATGKATDDESMQAEGEADQAKSDLKQAGENVKDAFKG